MNEFNTLIDKLIFDKMSSKVKLRVYIRLKSMLSVTRGKKCCIIKSMSSIIELTLLKIFKRTPDNFP